MLTLLLGLGAPASGGGDIDSVLSHDREPRQSGLGGLLGIFLRLLRDTPAGMGWSGRRGHAEGAV
jgi:hypothetical protein